MDKHIRSVLFIMHMPPPVHGASMVGKYIHDSKYINETFYCHYINLTTAKDLTDIGKVGIRKLKLFIQLLLRIRKAVKQVKPSLVYVTPNACGGAFYKDFIVIQMLKAMQCKVVVHYHNKGVETGQNRSFDNYLYRRFFRGIKVILLAEVLYRDIRKYVRQDDVYICPNGIPEIFSKWSDGERDNEVPHLLFLSNLLESKGVLVLLDACRILKDKGYQFVCDFVGGETAEIDRIRFSREVECRGLKRSVIYHGRKYGDDKMLFYRSADIFVFPTFYHNECFPLVLLEAMGQGVACIATEEGGIPNIIDDGKTGFIVEKKNATSLAAQMEVLINSPALCREMGRSGRIKFLQEFTLNKFENKICRILNDCLDEETY